MRALTLPASPPEGRHLTKRRETPRSLCASISTCCGNIFLTQSSIPSSLGCLSELFARLGYLSRTAFVVRRCFSVVTVVVGGAVDSVCCCCCSSSLSRLCRAYMTRHLSPSPCTSCLCSQVLGRRRVLCYLCICNMDNDKGRRKKKVKRTKKNCEEKEKNVLTSRHVAFDTDSLLVRAATRSHLMTSRRSQVHKLFNSRLADIALRMLPCNTLQCTGDLNTHRSRRAHCLPISRGTFEVAFSDSKPTAS